ncbi:MAG: DUF4350 domain-containing protein [Prevotella sp.]|nr:DUF4350 domain-containing protein [Prevotella sp.]
MSRRFLVFIAVLAVVMFAIQYRMPHRFSWQPTYSHTDRQPFGCYVLDSVLATSMPQGYTVTSKTLWQLSQDSTENRNYLVVWQTGGEGYVRQMLQMAARGDRFLVACDRWNSHLYDTLGVEVWSLYHSSSLRNLAQERDERDTIRWMPTGQTYTLHRSFIHYDMAPSDSLPCEVMAVCKWEVEKPPRRVAVRFPVGQGEIILVAMPLLFTNYGVLNRECEPLLALLLNEGKERPLVRLDPHAADATYSNQESPFYVWLKRPPLRWAIYLTLLSVLLFIVFTARRRQRVIPVIAPPTNNNMEFVRLIGTLYYQQGSHRDLLQKKLAYTIAEVRRQTGIDLQNDDDGPERLSAQTGQPVEEIYQTLARVRQACQQGQTMSNEQLHQYIDQLNKLL